MLIDTPNETYQEISTQAEPVEPVVALPSFRAAANSNSLEQAETRARRHRRQRRAERAAPRSISGWILRAW